MRVTLQSSQPIRLIILMYFKKYLGFYGMDLEYLSGPVLLGFWLVCFFKSSLGESHVQLRLRTTAPAEGEGQGGRVGALQSVF